MPRPALARLNQRSEDGRAIAALSIAPLDISELEVARRIIDASAQAVGNDASDRRLSWDELRAAPDQGHQLLKATIAGTVVGIMGLQAAAGAELVRHACVLPRWRRAGIGSALLDQLTLRSRGRLLVRIPSGAEPALHFFRRHGFQRPSREMELALLRNHWNSQSPEAETSIILARLGDGWPGRPW